MSDNMGLGVDVYGYKRQRQRFSQTTAPFIISEIDSFFLLCLIIANLSARC